MARALSWTPDLQASSGPLYIALSDLIARDIASGHLHEGTRLPPQRELAWALGITHGTVTRAYERAGKMGLVRAEVGRGTYVAPRQSPPSPLLPPSEEAPELDLARNFALPHLDPDLGETFAKLSTQAGLNRLLAYTPSEGLLRHREAGVKLFDAFDITTTLDRVMITSGAQHGLQILLQGLFKEGDLVAVDTMTYPNLISAAPRLGVRLAPIAADQHGMRADLLDDLCKKKSVAGLICIPNVQNPTGRSISAERLQALAHVAERHDLWVVEDDPYVALLSGPKHSMHQLIPDRVCAIATTSKVVGGGLRIGYLTAPDQVRSSLARVISNTSWMASPICAEIARHWILSGQMEQVLAIKRTALAPRQKLVKQIFGKAAELYPDRLSCWLHLPPEVNPAVFELEAARRGVSILGAHHFVVGSSPVPPAIRVAMGTLANDAHFAKAVQHLKDTLDELGAALPG